MVVKAVAVVLPVTPAPAAPILASVIVSAVMLKELSGVEAPTAPDTVAVEVPAVSVKL